ncbi:MAG: glycosyltransferase family 2 protein [Patescibacteria group bacterium]
MKKFIVIPAYNEEKTIANVINNVRKYYNNIIVIDDGSSDSTYDLATGLGVHVYRHIINRGLGGALGTGIAAALRHEADIIVTFDADGQHRAEDIARLIRPIEAGQADVVIGTRATDKEGMPLTRQLANSIGNLVTRLLFGIWVSDSQSGLRAFASRAAEKMQIRANRMEVSSEIIQEIKKHNLRLKEIPIKSIYTEYSLSKGQGFITGIKTLMKLVLMRLLK